MSLFPHAVTPLPAQALNSYRGSAHDWKDLVKVGPNIAKAILSGKIYNNKNPKQNKTTKKPQTKAVLWKGAPALRSLHSWRRVPRDVSSPECQEEAGRQNFSEELSSFSTEPTLHLQCVCQAEARPYGSRHGSGHHCTHLLSHTAEVH